MVTDILDELLVFAFLVSLWAVEHLVVVRRCTVHELTKEHRVRIQDFLGGNGMILCQFRRCVLLNFEEFIGLEQYHIYFR